MIKQNKHLLSTADPDNNIYNNTTKNGLKRIIDSSADCKKKKSVKCQKCIDF